jgi:hypothetical protein
VNIQNTIIRGIQESMQEHDYLVIPDFGGFVLKTRFSHFGSSGGNLLPPSKTLSFNLQLKQNDGVLATWLQTQLQCTQSESLDHLKEFAAYCRGVLSTRRRLSIDGIGFFFLDFENNVCFEPQSDVNFLKESFGLDAIALTEFQTPIAAERRVFEFEDRQVATVEAPIAKKVKRRYSYGQFLMPVMVLLVVLSSLFLLLNNRQLSGQLEAAFGTSVSGGVYSPATYLPLNLQGTSEQMTAYVADANGVANIKFEEGKAFAVQVKSDLKIESNSSVTLSRYEIVMGCFTKLDNARRLVKQLKQKNIAADLGGVNEKGMHIVSVGAFDTKDSAQEQLSSIKKSFPHAWLRQN